MLRSSAVYFGQMIDRLPPDFTHKNIYSLEGQLKFDRLIEYVLLRIRENEIMMIA